MQKPATVSKQKGFSLIDVMVGLGIFTILILGTSSLTSYMMSANADLDSKLEGPNLQNTINLSFASSKDSTLCKNQILTPTGNALTLPLPSPNVDLTPVPVAIANAQKTVFVFDGQRKKSTVFKVTLKGKWSRTNLASGSSPRTERFFASLDIQLTQPQSANSIQPKAISIPIVLDVESSTGLISSCTSHNMADDLSGGAHSNFDCINVGGDPVYLQSGQMVCKFSMHFLNGAPSISCPTYFKVNPANPINCIPDPQVFPITGCPNFPDGSKGSFCAVKSRVAYPSALACGSYSTSTRPTTSPTLCGKSCTQASGQDAQKRKIYYCICQNQLSSIPTDNGAFCTSQTQGVKACAPNFLPYKNPTGGGKTYQRCYANPWICKAPFFTTWADNLKTWSCTYTPDSCPQGLTTISSAPSLICQPLSNYLCTTPGVPCLNCPNGWRKVASGYSGITYSNGRKLSESVTCN